MPFLTILISILFFTITPSFTLQSSPIVIGVLVPLEHRAMTDIVEGLQTSLETNYPGKFILRIKNAQGDINLQRSILQQFSAQGVDIIVPIGTTATQMSAKMIKDIPLVSLAAFPDAYIQLKKAGKAITGVKDEISKKRQLDFLHDLIPNLSHMTLILSNSEKVIPEVEEIEQLEKEKGTVIQKLMIKDLPELYSAGKAIDPKTQILFILKDHLIVSGIASLAKNAKARKLPIMTSDEGSINGGGCFALGVPEKQIGQQGALQIISILEGQNAQEIPVDEMTTLTVFYNSQACDEQGVSVKNLKLAADKYGYKFSEVATQRGRES